MSDRREPPQSTQEAYERVGEDFRELFDHAAKGLRIPELLDWLVAHPRAARALAIAIATPFILGTAWALYDSARIILSW